MYLSKVGSLLQVLPIPNVWQKLSQRVHKTIQCRSKVTLELKKPAEHRTQANIGNTERLLSILKSDMANIADNLHYSTYTERPP